LKIKLLILMVYYGVVCSHASSLSLSLSLSLSPDVTTDYSMKTKHLPIKTAIAEVTTLWEAFAGPEAWSSTVCQCHTVIITPFTSQNETHLG